MTEVNENAIQLLLVVGSATNAGNSWLATLLYVVLVLTPVAGIPLACMAAVLKYRLYEIDRIISRTLAYAIVTGLLVGAYAGLVLLATRVLSVHTPVAVARGHAGGGGLVQPLAPAGAADRGPAVQPGPL